ncbi:MAG: hypothetical protein IIC24_02915 [Chloroflexi bacterium]|nr:hypothetical protein [Chloroflexota bacterium]
MVSPTLHDSNEKVADHVEALQAYARKVLVDGKPLSRLELVDKSVRLSEFVNLGNSFKLTVKEMIALILKDIYHQPIRCGCHSCVSREARA